LPDVSQRQRKGDLVGGKVDGLDLQRVASIQLRYQFRRCFIVSHAAVSETRKERIADRPLAVDDQAGAEPKLQRAGQRHAEQLPGFADRLNQCGGNDRLAGLGACVLAAEADFLGARLIAFAAELRPQLVGDRPCTGSPGHRRIGLQLLLLLLEYLALNEGRPSLAFQQLLPLSFGQQQREGDRLGGEVGRLDL
jgi:hypothetical protein